MQTIKRDIYVTKNVLQAPIEVTEGTNSIAIEFDVRDYDIPASAAAVAYSLSTSSMEEPNKALADVSGNKITIIPSEAFFLPGQNVMQIRIIDGNSKLISFNIIVKCTGKMRFGDEKEEQQSTLVEQMLAKLGEYQKKSASPYNFKGSCLSSELPASGNTINDTYYCTDLKYRKTWNGSAWEQSSLNEADYEDELTKTNGEVSSLKEDLMNLSRGEGLKNNSVKDVKLDIFEENNNLLNLEYITSGWLYSDGSIQSGTQKTTDYIPVNVGDVIYVGYQFSNGTKYGNQAIFSWCVYDKDYNLIDTYSKTNEISVIIPDNGAYVRLSLNSNYFTANVSIYKNTDTMPDYTDHSMVIKSKYIKIPPKNILYVKKDGICNDVISFYNSITSAINNSVDGDIIVILPGIYDEVITLGNTNLTIIGTDRDKCILRNTSGAYSNTPLFVSGNVSISNMTIKMDSEATTSRNGYALHIDRDGEGILHFSNCTFYNNVGAALGAGGQNNQYTYFDNCTFISDVRESNGVAETGYDGYGAMFFHAPTSENIVGCGAEFKNCIFKSNLNRVITLSSIQDKSDMYLTFINCNVYSKYNKHNNVVHFNATNHLFIDDMSYGNSTSELN